MRLLWLVGGFALGVAVGRNAQGMSAPLFSAVALGALLCGAVGWWAARRDRVSAVATAVASAEATATARLEAELAAQASALALAQGGSVYIGSGWLDESTRHLGDPTGAHHVRPVGSQGALVVGESAPVLPITARQRVQSGE